MVKDNGLFNSNGTKTDDETKFMDDENISISGKKLEEQHCGTFNPICGIRIAAWKKQSGIGIGII